MSSEHHRPSRSMRSPRRATIGAAIMCLSAFGATTGVTLAQGAPAAAHRQQAKPPVGSDLGALSVSASSVALNVPFYSHTAEDVEANSPYSLATLGTGGIGEGLTSIFYPGGTGAHGGDTLNLLGIAGLPPSVGQMLNDPAIALAQTGVGKSTVDMSHPGLTMKSTATSTHVSAETAAGGSGIPVVGPIVGSSSAKSTINITGPRTVTVNSVSSIHNVSVAKVIKIGAVTSIAHAVTDGHTASGSAKTVVSGMKIAGVAVTIDNKGLHVPGKSLPLVGNTAAKAVNTALKSSGIQMALTNVKRKVHGAHAKLDSGALVIKFGNAQYNSQANDTGNLLVLGGAQIDAQARPGFKTPPIKKVKTPKPPPVHQQSTGGTPGTSGTPGTPGTTSQLPAGGAVSQAPTTAQAPLLAANRLALPPGLKMWWTILALAGAGLFAFGMKRLPDKVLQPAGATCRLEEQP